MSSGCDQAVWCAGHPEVAAVFYWSLLFQPPDQIEVGEDGFRQWDGKIVFNCRKPSNTSIPCCICRCYCSNLSHNGILSVLGTVTLFMPSTFPCVLSLCSYYSYGYGGHGQHYKGLDWESCQVCPFPRCEALACGRCGKSREADPHTDCGGLPALQLHVSLAAVLHHLTLGLDN